MPLNKDILGMALYTERSAFCNRTMDDLIAQYGTKENIMIAMCKADAEAIINHFKANALVSTTGTAAAQTGTIS